MFATSSQFDYLMDLSFPSESDCHPRRMLQAALRERFILRLRRHESVSEDDMMWLRDCCRQAGSVPQFAALRLAGSAFPYGSGTVFSWERLGAPPIQQDAGEFYEWLINALDGPKVRATASTV